MSKAFTREDDAAPEDDFDGDEDANPIPPGSKNYLTPGGWRRMRDELTWLVKTELEGRTEPTTVMEEIVGIWMENVEARITTWESALVSLMS